MTNTYNKLLTELIDFIRYEEWLEVVKHRSRSVRIDTSQLLVKVHEIEKKLEDIREKNKKLNILLE